MLYYVSGPVTVLEPGLAVIDCGGVGYGCRVTAYTAAQLKLNQSARLYITESIREDAFDLYGFISKEEQHCYENGMAERVNGILKLEYGLEFNQLTYENCIKNVKQAIEFYNTQRPHQSLSYRTPSEVYEESRNQQDAVSLSV